MKVAILAALPGAVISIGDDAATQMMHYMQNTGPDSTIDLEGMVVEVASGKDRYTDVFMGEFHRQGSPRNSIATVH